MPNAYLLKTEPSTYSFADLQKEGTTVWDGVANPVAVKNLRGMKSGDKLVIYHTGDEKSVVGTASVVSVDASDGEESTRHHQGRKAAWKAAHIGRVEGELKIQRLAARPPIATVGRATH